MRFSDPIAHIKSHLSQGNLEQMRNVALTTAGFSAAIIILLSQLRGTASYSAISLWASIISMVVWLFAFRYVNVSSAWRACLPSHQHLRGSGRRGHRLCSIVCSSGGDCMAALSLRWCRPHCLGHSSRHSHIHPYQVCGAAVQRVRCLTTHSSGRSSATRLRAAKFRR